MTLLRREKAAWFPAEELRDDNNVQPHKVEIIIGMLGFADLMSFQITEIERIFLGWREDGREGVCCISENIEEEEEAAESV